MFDAKPRAGAGGFGCLWIDDNRPLLSWSATALRLTEVQERGLIRLAFLVRRILQERRAQLTPNRGVDAFDVLFMLAAAAPVRRLLWMAALAMLLALCVALAGPGARLRAV
jgi:hypothetical protein